MDRGYRRGQARHSLYPRIEIAVAADSAVAGVRVWQLMSRDRAQGAAAAAGEGLVLAILLEQGDTVALPPNVPHSFPGGWRSGVEDRGTHASPKWIAVYGAEVSCSSELIPPTAVIGSRCGATQVV